MGPLIGARPSRSRAPPRAAPATAPPPVARAFTTSFVIHRHPRTCSAGYPHRPWTGASVGWWHLGHQYPACTVAPIRESPRAPSVPATPASSTAPRAGRRVCNRRTVPQAAPTVSAPATEARVPSGVTPPEVPGGTGRSVVSKRGPRRAKRPSSVPQVSAPAVARAPRKPPLPRPPAPPRDPAGPPSWPVPARRPARPLGLGQHPPPRLELPLGSGSGRWK